MILQGKGALVTGGASGIGKATVNALLEKGCKVCIVDIDVEAGERTAEEFKKSYGDKSVLFYDCDVNDADQLKRAFEHSKEVLDRLDIVVNSAAFIGEGVWEKTINTNLVATVRGCHLALNLMRADRGNSGGVVVNVGSLAGLLPMAVIPVYSATKAAIVGLTRALADRRDFLQTQVRFNCVCPSLTDTPLVDPNFIRPEHWGDDLHYWSDTLTKLEKSELVRPEQVAEAVIEVIENSKHNGAVMHASCKGRELVKPPAITLL